MRQPGAYSGIVGSAAGRSHALPLARIKKIMKRSGSGGGGGGEGSRMMISGEAPIVLAKACEQFIEELTKRSWVSASSQGKRRTIQKEDVASAVHATELFDFLVHLTASSQQQQQHNHELVQYVSDVQDDHM